MDNISHACVGHSLSHTHHDGMFFPTIYLGLDRVSLILEKIKFQNPLKYKDKNLIWEDGSPHERSTKGNKRKKSSIIDWVDVVDKQGARRLLANI